MSILVGLKKNPDNNTDACTQIYSLTNGSLQDTLKHTFENAGEVSSIDFAPDFRSFFGVDKKSNHIIVWSLHRKVNFHSISCS